MTLRVAYVCADPGIPVFGTKGASVHIQEIVRAWRARGAHVEIFAVRRGEDVPADLADVPVHVVRVGGKDLDAAERERAQAAAAERLTEMVLALEPDVVYERYSLFSRALAGAAASPTPPVRVLEVNAPLIDEQRTHRVLVDEEGAGSALAAQLAAADVVACVSEPVADWVRARAGAATPPVTLRHDPVVVPNGVNTDRIRPADVAPAPRSDATGTTDTPVVVFVGTLKPWHGVEDLVAAAGLAARPWRLRLVGDGPQRATIEELARRHGLDVDLVGAVAPERIPEHLHGALVAVAPYPDTGQDHYFSPLKVYEYAAAGLAVVASRIGQIPRVVRDGDTGLVVPGSDPAALAAAIDALVADPARAREMGRRGRNLMVAEHSWHHVLAATLGPVVDRLPAPRSAAEVSERPHLPERSA